MPVQTSKKANVYFPDGALVSIKADQESTFTDVGAINSTVAQSWTWTENEVETSNAGDLETQYRSMRIEGSFTLINLEPESVERMSGGALTRVVTTATPFVDAPDYVISNGDWADKGINNLTITTAAGADVKATAVSLTSVTGSVDGALVADDDYTLFQDSNSKSGWSIMLNLAGTALTTVSQDITIDYNSVTPIESEALTGGHSTFIAKPYAMKITHTDDNGLIRELELYSVNTLSGGFAFNFKGANEDGVEEMPLTYRAKLDTNRTNGDQLFKWTTEANAQ